MKIAAAQYAPAILLVVCSIMFFSHLSAVPPTIMEARNFISAREMLESGNYLVPTLNGQTRIRKPPLPTWFTLAAIGGDPYKLFALRFPAAMVGTLMIFFLYGLAKDLLNSKTVAFYAAAVLATSYMVVEESKTGAWDIYCTAFMLGAVWMLYRASKSNHFKYWILAGAFMGLSFMSKGPVSFYAMLTPFLAAFFISKNKFSGAPPRGWMVCVLVTVLISAAWPLYLYLNLPEASSQIVDEETSAWLNRHNRPIWFYLHFPLFTGVWTLMVLFALFSIKKLQITFGAHKIQLVFFWFLISFILLSIVPEKKERYFLPALPPLAILTGAFIAHQLKNFQTKKMEKEDVFMLTAQGILMALAALGIIIFLWFYAFKYEGISGYAFLFFSLLSFTLSGLFIYFLYRKKYQYIYPATVIPMLCFCLTCWPFLPNIGFDNNQYRDLKDVRHIPEIMDKPLYSVVALNPERLWAIGRKVKLIDPEDTIAPEGVIITAQPMKEAEYIYAFHYNPENEQDVLYFNVP